MIPKQARAGKDTLGLLRYLYGPGRRNEHTDAHLVAAWDADLEDPARSPAMTLADLALLLDAPVRALRSPPQRHVYHVAVRIAPEDRRLSDAEWVRVAAEMMHVAGIAPHGDPQGCRWVAVRHAEDHIHIVATLARQDGHRPSLRWSIVRMQAAARRLEAELGLRQLTSGDKTARIWPKTGELEKATQRGLPQTPRETLHRLVRAAAAAADGEADFFARVAAAGVRVRQRVAPDGRVTGYAVALPGDRDHAQHAVWFSGARLAPDLSLPRVRERWTHAARTEASAQAWRTAAEQIRAAAAELGASGLHRGAGDVAALGDLVVVAAEAAPAWLRPQMSAAAGEFERASRAPAARELEGQARALYRSSARTLAAAAGRADAAALLGVLVALVEAVAACQRWHQAQRHRAQAASAARAGRLLRQAVEVTAGATARQHRTRARSGRRAPGRPDVPGRGAAAGRRREAGESMVSVVQAVLPELAPQLLADPAWPALRTRMATLDELGHNPGPVLAAVAAQRELGTAQSAAEVLTWRLDGWIQATAPPASRVDAGRPARPPGAGTSKKPPPPAAPGLPRPRRPRR